MAEEYIIVGMGKAGEEKGIYSFRWTEKDTEGLPVLYFTKKKPDFLGKDGADLMLTPRCVKCFDDVIYVVTRGDIRCLEMPRGVFREISRKELSDLFVEELVKTEFKKDFLPNGLLQVSMSRENTDYFLALFFPQKFKTDPPGRRDGFLLHSRFSTFNDAQVVSKCSPTGNILALEQKILVPSGRRLVTFVKENSKYVERGHLEDMKGRVLSFASRDGYTVCTDDRWGYVLDYNGVTQRFCPPDKFNYFSDTEQVYLPATNATSSLLVSHENKMYALFGMGDGKVGVYEISVQKKTPSVRFCNVVSFLTEQSSLREANKDNNIYSLQEQSGSVSFTLRDHYFRVRIDTLLRYDSSKNIVQNGKGKFPSDFCTHYVPGPLQRDGVAYGVPHRILAWDFLRTTGEF